MLPSFRILAFYLQPKGTGQDPELVADSILIDVNDKCQEKVSLTPHSCTPPSQFLGDSLYKFKALSLGARERKRK